jgi:hypothetical protein
MAVAVPHNPPILPGGVRDKRGEKGDSGSGGGIEK